MRRVRSSRGARVCPSDRVREASGERKASLKARQSNPHGVARRSIEWVTGDPTWSRVYAIIRWAGLPISAFTAAVLVLNILWDAGEIASTPAGILSWTVPLFPFVLWLFLGPALVLGFAGWVILTRKAVYKIAPTDRGLALHVPLFWTRLIPWTDIRWTSPTRLEWIQLLGTGRATVTPDQSQRIYRWFYPS